MAYSVTGNTSPTIRRNGVHWYAFWHIVETDVGTTSEYTISLADLRAVSGEGNLFTMTLVAADLTTAGTAATIRPKFGRATGWTVDTVDHIAQASAAASNHRITTDAKFLMAHGANTIYCRSTPNAGTATTVTTEISIRIGH